jgi:hypothetical protein
MREVADAAKKEAIDAPIREAKEKADAAAKKEAARLAYEKTLVNPFTGIVEHPDGRKTDL